ncbi:hypothetical protein V2J09_006843 [Rumex salicifolius]
MKEAFRYLTGIAGKNGFGSKSTADQVTLASSSHPPLTAIITGATSGIGLETARVLAKRGIRIILAARNMNKAEQVKELILKETPNADIMLMEIDLSSFASISRFCSHFLSLGLPLNILINNAGVFSHKLEYSEDKIEMTFATNYLGHFLLTELVLEKMIETAEESGVKGRIINVSSCIHTWVKKGDFYFNQMLNPTNYNGTRAYAQSKLAGILHAKQLATQLKARNARVIINAVHPGILLKTASQGAATTCYVAMREEVEDVNGGYFADCNEQCCSTLAADFREAESLWTQTRALIISRLN